MAEDRSGGDSKPATQAFVISPSDTADLPGGFTRGIYVGGTGNLRVDMIEGPGDVLFQAVPAGTVLPIRVKKVWSTNTTATLMVGMF